MKRFLINIAIFFGIVGVCDLCFGYVCDYMQTHPKGGETKLFNDLMANDCHEVLVLGSSRAYHHYDPDILEQQLGLESYNAGFDGKGVILAYPILYNILDRSCNPKLVIFEVTPGFDILVNSNDDDNHRYIAPLKPYYRIPVVGEVVRSVSLPSYIQFHSGLFRYNSEFLTVAMNYLKPRSMDYKGYQPLEGTYQYKPPVASHLSQKYDSLKLQWLHKFAQLKRDHNLNMVWVMSPQFDSVDVSYNAYMVAKDLAAQYDIPVFDYYFDTAYVGHAEYFKDASHLNSYGATVFSKMLAKELKPFVEQN